MEHANGNTQVARPVIPVYVDNGGKASGGTNADWLRPTGWYKEDNGPDWGYVHAAIGLDDVPTGKVSGTWKPKIKVAVNGGSKAPNISGWSVHVDPNFHDGDSGITVASGKGAFKGAIAVDTSKLSKGSHRLVIRATQDLGDRHHEAVGVIPFEVDS